MKRNYGIDLLRLVLMYMVCLLHTLGRGGILAASVVGTVNYAVYWLLETSAFCAVDGFALVSGYVAQDKPQKYEKLVNMWFQAFFYSCIVTLVLHICGLKMNASLPALQEMVFPVSFSAFWYVTAYFVLFLAMPLLNSFLFSLEEPAAKKALLVFFVLFSVIGFWQEPFGTDEGYSALWLMILYCIGVLAKRIHLFEQKKTWLLFLLWLVCILLSWIAYVFFGFLRGVRYVTPTILLCAIIMVVLFSRLKLPDKMVRAIKHLSPLAFGIYLFQMNRTLWDKVLLDGFSFVASMPLIPGVLCACGIAVVIFFAGLIVEWCRTKLMNAIGIHRISEKIVEWIDQLLGKLFPILN
ncbi:MAG: acyltransferase family protein [Clostridia bacterium]|nr:acyltransferase family protein [Clostridia bacterium]